MVEFLKLIFISLIHSLCEFLPISSSAHLLLLQIILPKFYLYNNIDNNIDNLNMFLHFGSLLAIILYFYKDISKFFIIFNKKKKEKNLLQYKKYKELLFSIIIGTIPLVIFGLFLKNIRFNNIFLGVNLIIFGFFMYFCDKKCKSEIDLENISILKALFIGFFQVLAVFPGVSRLGVTFMGARILKIKKLDAIKFSFFLSIPAMCGSFALGCIKFFKNDSLYMIGEMFSILKIVIFLLVFILTFIMSRIFIGFFIEFLNKHDFKIFFIYRLIIGILIIIYYFLEFKYFNYFL